MAKNPEGTAADRERAANWMREQARKHGQKTGQNPDKLEREIGRVLHEGDRRKSDTGRRG